MSHFTTIKTKCTDQDLLVKSIQQIGYVAKIGKFNCRGYQGNKTTVDILINLSNNLLELIPESDIITISLFKVSKETFAILLRAKK